MMNFPNLIAEFLYALLKDLEIVFSSNWCAFRFTSREEYWDTFGELIVNFYCSLCYRFAGAMERLQAESELINRVNSTYLVRHRTKESGEYAISIK